MSKMIMLFLMALLGVLVGHAQPKSLFYMTTNPDSVRSFMSHADKIDIIVPTWYNVDENGTVWGGPNPLVLRTAKEHHVPVIPIVVAMFHTKGFHTFLHDDTARKAFADALPRECERNGYSGFQIDFEDVSWTDRDALSSLVAETAAALHSEGFQLSIATVAGSLGFPGQTEFGYWMYRDWRGVYDLKALAKSVDMVCLMTYDQHTSLTPPGPVAGYPWVVENLDFALNLVPKEKLSMGIPLYGYHWHTRMQKEDTYNVTADYISAQDAMQLTREYDGKIQWDSEDLSTWCYFYRDGAREWIFFTDTQTFERRLDLVKKRGLEGFCSWVLGMEDQGIWELLASHQ